MTKCLICGKNIEREEILCLNCGYDVIKRPMPQDRQEALRSNPKSQAAELAQLRAEVARLRLAIRYAAQHLSTPEYDLDCECEPCREAAAFHAVVKEISNVG